MGFWIVGTWSLLCDGGHFGSWDRAVIMTRQCARPGGRQVESELTLRVSLTQVNILVWRLDNIIEAVTQRVEYHWFQILCSSKFGCQSMVKLEAFFITYFRYIKDGQGFPWGCEGVGQVRKKIDWFEYSKSQIQIRSFIRPRPDQGCLVCHFVRP